MENPTQTTERFVLTTKELTDLIQKCKFVDLEFGIGWAALTWDTNKPMPEAVLELGRLRGVLEQGMYGDGI